MGQIPDKNTGIFAESMPWHKSGKFQTDPFDFSTAMAHGLDYKTEKRQLFTTSNDGLVIPVPEQYAIVRTDTDTPLGVVGERYTCIANEEAFAPMSDYARFVSAFPMFGGRTACLLALAPESSIVIAGDEIRRYILAMTTHDGSGTTNYRNCDTRVVCENTLATAMSERVSRSLRVSHTKNYKDKLAQFRAIMQMIEETGEAFKTSADELLGKSFSRDQFQKLVAQLLPPPTESDPNFTDRQARSWEKRFHQVMVAYASTDLENIRNTAWGAYNAITDYEQHYSRANGDDMAQAEAAFRRAVTAPRLASHAFELLTA